MMRDLRETQRHIKDNSENYSNQMKIFKDLRYLLDMKTRQAANGGDGLEFIGQVGVNTALLLCLCLLTVVRGRIRFKEFFSLC